jgi:hypothetical protein
MENNRGKPENPESTPLLAENPEDSPAKAENPEDAELLAENLAKKVEQESLRPPIVVKARKVSKFKDKAPKERGKEGRLAERIQKGRAEQEKHSLAQRSRWIKRAMSIALFSLIIYFGLAPLIKTEFYKFVAKSQDDEWFFWALNKLAERSESSAVPLYMRGLKSPDPNQKLRYVKLINELGSEDHKDAILLAIGSREMQERRLGLYAFFILAKRPWLQKKSDHELIARVLMKDADKMCRIYSALIFEKLSPPSETARIALEEGAFDAAPSVRRISLNALSRYRDPSFTKTFIKQLKDKLPEVRIAAAGALAVLGNDRAIIALSDHYNESEALERSEVIDSLQDVQAPSATRVLIRAAEDGDQKIAASAVKYMSHCRSRVVNPALVRALDSSSGLVRIAATKALGLRNVREAIPMLIKNLDHFEGWRELEALDDALQRLSGAKDIPPPKAPEESHQATVKAWKTWYAKRKAS